MRAPSAVAQGFAIGPLTEQIGDRTQSRCPCCRVGDLRYIQQRRVIGGHGEIHDNFTRCENCDAEFRARPSQEWDDMKKIETELEEKR